MTEIKACHYCTGRRREAVKLTNYITKINKMNASICRISKENRQFINIAGALLILATILRPNLAGNVNGNLKSKFISWNTWKNLPCFFFYFL